MQWVSVRDRNPWEGVEVLVCYRWADQWGGDRRGIALATRHETAWIDRECNVLEVLHWAPLPILPQES